MKRLHAVLAIVGAVLIGVEITAATPIYSLVWLGIALCLPALTGALDVLRRRRNAYDHGTYSWAAGHDEASWRPSRPFDWATDTPPRDWRWGPVWTPPDWWREHRRPPRG